MSEWLWFLLPIAAASGWLVARTAGGKAPPARPGAGIPPEYLLGLGLLLDQQHDKATEVFIKLFEVDSDTVETHLVLGNLFRQKGEVERAIRIHHNVIARPRLSDYHRASALLELGRDYFSAGLLDRAETFFNHVLSMRVEPLRIEAYSHLVSLYEMEKSWREAIDAARQLRKRNVRDYSDRVAHYYCELAEQALDQEHHNEARKLISKTKSGAGAAMRVTVLRGDVDFACGEVEAAEKQYVKAFEGYPQYAGFILPKLRGALKRLNTSEFADYLKRLQPETMSTSYLMTLCRALIESDRIGEVERLFSALVEQQRVPLSVLRLYLEYKEQGGIADKALIVGVIRSLVANEHAAFSYQCSSCGFGAHRLHWQCPSCHRWGTAEPQDRVAAPPAEVGTQSSAA